MANKIYPLPTFVPAASKPRKQQKPCASGNYPAQGFPYSLLLANLVANCARSLAGRLAGSLALAAAAGIDRLLQGSSINRNNVLCHRKSLLPEFCADYGSIIPQTGKRDNYFSGDSMIFTGRLDAPGGEKVNHMEGPDA